MSKSAQLERTLVNKKGGSLTTTLSDQQAFKIVEKSVKLNPHKNTFATNLVTTCKRHGLTDEQFWWIHKIAQMEIEGG